MRLVVERAGKREEVEVASDLSSVTVNGRSYPLVVVATTANRVELEIDGEKAVVENWPEHFASPFGPVDVNGERWSVSLEARETEGPPSAPRAASTPPSSELASASPGAAAGTGPVLGAAPTAGDGIPVVPSMPGRVIELKVAEGDRVRKGDTLLILEAMKMRGEVSSPADGVVSGLRVSAGTNARAKEPMMWIRPEALERR